MRIRFCKRNDEHTEHDEQFMRIIDNDEILIAIYNYKPQNKLWNGKYIKTEKNIHEKNNQDDDDIKIMKWGTTHGSSTAIKLDLSPSRRLLLLTSFVHAAPTTKLISDLHNGQTWSTNQLSVGP